MYNVTPGNIASAMDNTITVESLKGNWAVTQQLIRAKAVNYRAEHNGEEPSYNQLISFGVEAVMQDPSKNCGYSESQLRAAGIISMENLGNDYVEVKDWYHNVYYIDVWHAKQIAEGTANLRDVVEAAEEAEARGEGAGDPDNQPEEYDMSKDNRTLREVTEEGLREVGEKVSEAAEAAEESITEHVENNIDYANGEGTDENGNAIDPAEPGNTLGI